MKTIAIRVKRMRKGYARKEQYGPLRIDKVESATTSERQMLSQGGIARK